MRRGSDGAGEVIGGIFVLLVAVASIAGWFQHLYTCFTGGHWGFLVAGAIFAPVAVIHGWGIWAGVW